MNGDIWRRRSRWEKMCLKDVGWESMEWINVAEDRDDWQVVMNTVKNP
jgi:hypothetical protein